MRESSDAAPTVREEEVEFSAMRASGPGGQNVNKVSTAIHLRFDIQRSSLPAEVKERLLALPGRRVTKDGVLVIKAQSARSQEQNKNQAMQRLQDIVGEAAQVQALRRPTKPTRASKRRRLQDKAERSEIKAGRGKVNE
jgi:ribosome-associated protein